MRLHPNDLALQEFYLCQSEEHRALLAHVAQCRRCALLFQGVVERLVSVPAGPREEEDEADLLSPCEEFLEQAISDRELALIKERSGAPALLVELMRLSPRQQRLLIQNSPRFRTLGLCEILLERCMETVVHNPASSESLALLAIEVAERLDSSRYRRNLVQDLRARAWAHVGNARRAGLDLRSAEDAFRKAKDCLRQGSRDPVELAIILSLEASLHRARCRFQEALRLLRRAVTIFLRNGHAHRAGRSLVSMDLVHCYAGQPESGIPLLHRALELIDPDREPRLRLCAQHNLIQDLAEAGRFLEAQKVYRETCPLYREFPDPWTQNRRKWVKGKIARGLGRSAQAERLFLAARYGFIENGVSYDTALVSLELAILYSRENRTADLKRLAQEMLPIFSSLQIHREALAALTFLQQALDAERANLALVSRVADFLRRAEHDPGLRFEP